eukprot:CAMPEP_0172608770 /NCGR_PEP_ID=MMETSP1068-20121228/28829_1 /TAXON_ID=35684 /ORGANISM="Pseudopedinella elastica, Strain CCMP716" /LENGTH=356 /DNA_ID=CAMNT_0013412117 /DNA_START=183 /DNA_END=1251 /DNA_ORIENTATION=-
MPGCLRPKGTNKSAALHSSAQDTPRVFDRETAPVSLPRGPAKASARPPPRPPLRPRPLRSLRHGPPPSCCLFAPPGRQAAVAAAERVGSPGGGGLEADPGEEEEGTDPVAGHHGLGEEHEAEHEGERLPHGGGEGGDQGAEPPRQGGDAHNPEVAAGGEAQEREAGEGGGAGEVGVHEGEGGLELPGADAGREEDRAPARVAHEDNLVLVAPEVGEAVVLEVEDRRVEQERAADQGDAQGVERGRRFDVGPHEDHQPAHQQHHGHPVAPAVLLVVHDNPVDHGGQHPAALKEYFGRVVEVAHRHVAQALHGRLPQGEGDAVGEGQLVPAGLALVKPLERRETHVAHELDQRQKEPE